MKLHDIEHIAVGLSIFAACYILTVIPLLEDKNTDSSLFTAQQTECVPTILWGENDLKAYGCGYVPGAGFTEDSAQDLMDKLVKYTVVIPTKDTAPDISWEDAQILMTIGQSEADIDGVEGIAAVIQTVLNRVESDQFPNTVKEVVNQKTQLSDGRWTYQFSPLDNTIDTYNGTDLNLSAHLALAAVERGDYEWLDALYFENAEDSWQSKNCTYICTIGHHKFYK